MSVLLDICPITGAVEIAEYDRNEKSMLITRTENVDALLARNEASYNDPSEGWRGDDNDFWHVASVPLTTLYGWMLEFNQGRAPADQLKDPFDARNEEWERYVWHYKLNMGENRKLRTAPVRI